MPTVHRALPVHSCQYLFSLSPQVNHICGSKTWAAEQKDIKPTKRYYRENSHRARRFLPPRKGDKQTNVGRILQLIQQNNLREAHKEYSEDPTNVCATALISAYGWRGNADLKSALRVWNELMTARVSPNVRVYGALIKACCSAGDRQRGFEIYQSMRQRNNITPDAQCFGILTNACAQAKDAALTSVLIREFISRMPPPL